MTFPKVKICGMTRPQDVEVALAEGADYLGFILYEKSPRSITLSNARSLFTDSRVPEEKRVLVEVNPDPDHLARCQEIGFSLFQIHFPLDLSRDRIASWIDVVGLENLWLAPRFSQDDSFPDDLWDLAETFLVDASSTDAYGGTGHTADWERFSAWKSSHSDKSWILAGGLSPENVAEAVAVTGTERLDANSGLESAPGIKDAAKVQAFFARLQTT